MRKDGKEVQPCGRGMATVPFFFLKKNSFYFCFFFFFFFCFVLFPGLMNLVLVPGAQGDAGAGLERQSALSPEEDYKRN